MAPRRREAAGKHGRLLVAAVAAALLAAIVIMVVRPIQDESAAAFDYALGVNPSELDDTQLATVLDKAEAAGVTSISSGATWWYLDKSPRSYDWSDLDRLVSGAEARRMKIKLQLAGTPDWVHPDLVNTVPAHSDRVWYPPREDTELHHWSNFVYDVVSRYEGRVESYEMWNEPNISDFWKPNPNPSEYAALLRAGYLSAKNAYPDAKVTFGGLSRNDRGYLSAYYSEVKEYPEAPAKTYFFDLMNVQPYSSIPSTTDGGLEEPISPDRNTSSAVFDEAYGEVDQNFLGLKKIKIAMDDQDDPEKSIFLGEYGFSTTDTWMKAVPDSRRALYLKVAYALASDLPYVEGMQWFTYHPTDSTGPEWSIVDADLNETLTFRALKQITGAERRYRNL